ncbi:MAG TPA: RNA methyltransferase [Alphaproteobacteria bacterium]|nr:RNA methyltransferase [Alphaproteobacteria bacterium]
MSAPVIILVRPQLVENIGAAARAMMNCNLSEMRLVNPRDPWPLVSPQKERIAASASGADAILENAKVFETTAEAVADLHAVYATTARNRDMVKEVVTPRKAIAELAAHQQNGQKTGILFGPERTGLINDDLICAEKIVHIPANPQFASLNLSQGVLVAAYEWLMHETEAPPSELPLGKTRAATREELFHLFDHLERELDTRGFFTTVEMKPAMVQNLRNALSRAQFTEQEVRTLHGVITALAGPQQRQKQG